MHWARCLSPRSEAACFGAKRAVGDADCGDDRSDTARAFCSGEDDQGDRARPEAVAQHGAQSPAIGGEGIFLRARGSAAAESGSMDGRPRSAVTSGERPSAGARASRGARGRPTSPQRLATTRFGRRASPPTSKTAGRLRRPRRWRTMPARARLSFTIGAPRKRRSTNAAQVHEIRSDRLGDPERSPRLRDNPLPLGSARTKRTRQSSEALLAGKLFDDWGNRMSPTWARKGSKRWRYYVSQAALQGDKSKAGSIVRVPAPELEALVTEAVGKLSADHPASQTDIRDRIDRVAIGGTAIQIRLSEVGEGDDSVKTLTLPWTAPSPHRRREIIQGASATTGARPMRARS
jgi:hypothetical protein